MRTCDQRRYGSTYQIKMAQLPHVMEADRLRTPAQKNHSRPHDHCAHWHINEGGPCMVARPLTTPAQTHTHQCNDEGGFKSFLTGSQDLKVNLFGLQQDKCSDGNGKNNDVGIAR